ncbi:NAD(P)/FAD-dependent oxidoreductase [Halobacillus salinarum]|uniref:NAD(P)/FAD-dependent oxidoreductase n=1 Tax=Halobacillus salinarum TaxID=2932257 RepID=A0ABY4EGI6_9BACI|nr:NAD(P)/FAD-dependent oxidoreductase [Halobacillus salinarum]UOQ43249.1 NAD(P)/FAD-dependent oxidoreductase [Halobacillus salinarum]
MNHAYDVLVIGTGAAGSRAAAAAKRNRLSTAIVDHRSYGGTCPQRGCDPKRVLAGIAEIYDDASRVNGKGLTGEVSLSWKDLVQYKNTFTTPVPEQVESSLKEKGIDTYHGTASFIDPNTIKVGEHQLQAGKFVIATGASPASLPIEGSEHMITSDDFFELEELPDNLLFVGGGYISFEFAHLCARLGKNVTIVHRNRHVLEGFDKEITNKLVEHTKDLGVTIHTSTEVQSIEKLTSGKFQAYVRKFDHEHELTADLVIHGAGRHANLKELGLESIGLEYSKRGVPVNHNFQAIFHPHIYAAGDAAETGLKPLTPVAGEEAERLSRHLIHGEEQTPISLPVPSVVFTYPMLASVGITQQEAKENDIPYEVQSRNISDFFTYKRTDGPSAYVKLLINPFTDEILGAHFLSSYASHLINLFSFAMYKKATKQDLQQMLWAYPTPESDIPSMF